MENVNAVPVTAPRSIEELQKEIARLDSIDTRTNERVDKLARLEGIDTFDAHRVYDELNLRATIMENTAHKFYLKEVELKPTDERWADIYGHSAKAYEDSASMVRLAMTSMIRLEKYKLKLIKTLNK